MEVKLFGLEEAYVKHAVPHAWQAILITLAPFLLGTVLGLELLIFAFELFSKQVLLSILFYWLGFSIVLFSFPSDADAMNAFHSVKNSLAKRISHGNAISRILWIIVSPFIFLPLLLMTGFFLLFDQSSLLRFAWTILLFILSFNSGMLIGFIAWIDSLLQGFFNWIFKGIL
jgi:hypothetical protein